MFEMNRPERRALLLGTVLLVLGGAVRAGLGPGPATFSWEARDERSDSGRNGAAGQPSLERVRAGVGRNLARSRRAATPLAPGERIDINRAPPEELERLPGVGPATARRIVRERERRGGFARPEDLSRVPGLGAKRVNRILPYLLDHSLPYFERPPEADRAARERTKDGSLQGSAPRLGGPDGSGDSDRPRLDLNVATEEQLRRLPGVGPAIARRIVRMRDREGPFKDVQKLRKVPGIGPARFDIIKDLVLVR
ncbi:MAG: helix-hairpin-helix domain-containing protein [Candidatus Palauibacterales bacterium]|nr:helix-hairpin-helix domain-containing protein [Candidatus Palauibacterales bacterium]MDP2530584.1 helix-hairpin-helix domain-containing protein [Candidatus Palauibacterales bacterium]MDP2583617.1 helix-hairpin-helix domain-containing protein [Candidatus Palauibacterales bacterium]